MNESFNVKVFRCSVKSGWYKDRIGETYLVRKYKGSLNIEGWYQVVGASLLLRQEDVEILEEKE